MRPIPLFVIAALAAATATAQCQFTSLSLQSYGQGCTTVFTVPPTLAGGLDGPTCTLNLTVIAFTGCCNTFLRFRVLALGVQQINLPLPQIGPGCALLVDPLATLFLQTNGGDTFALRIPPLLPPPLQLQAQAAAIYVTFGVALDAQLTEGQTITLQ
jgi:hypothetical protein